MYNLIINYMLSTNFIFTRKTYCSWFEWDSWWYDISDKINI